MNDSQDPSDEAYVQEAMARLTPIEPSAMLARRVAKIPIEHPRRAREVWPFQGVWQPGLALAAAAAMGFFIGNQWMTTPSSTSEATAARPVAPIASSNAEEEDALQSEALEDLFMLATAGDLATNDFPFAEPESEEL